MSTETYMYKLTRDLVNQEMTVIRSIVLHEKLHAKVADHRPPKGTRRVEVVVGDPSIMDNLAALFTRRTQAPLPFEEHKPC